MVQETETLKHTFQGMLAHVTLVSVVVWLVGSPSRLTTTQPRLEPLDLEILAPAGELAELPPLEPMPKPEATDSAPEPAVVQMAAPAILPAPEPQPEITKPALLALEPLSPAIEPIVEPQATMPIEVPDVEVEIANPVEQV